MLENLSQWPVAHCSAAIVVDSKLVETYGDTGKIFELASVTKLLVAHTALVAIEEGAIALDQAAGPVGATVRHLLSHASGIAFSSNTIQAPVATERIYSSAGYDAIAELISVESGIDFPDYFFQALCEPLGLTATTLNGSAGHGAQSTVDDLLKVLLEFLAPQLVSMELFTRAKEVQFPGLQGFVPGYGKFKPNDWGLGFEIKGHKGDVQDAHWLGTKTSPRTVGHFGQSGTFLWLDPERNAGVVVLTDEPFGSWAKPLWSKLNDSIVEAVDELRNSLGH